MLPIYFVHSAAETEQFQFDEEISEEPKQEPNNNSLLEPTKVIPPRVRKISNCSNGSSERKLSRSYQDALRYEDHLVFS